MPGILEKTNSTIPAYNMSVEMGMITRLETMK
jgi:hypothetical protein